MPKKYKILVNRIIEWLIYIVGYAIILSIVSFLFKDAIKIDTSYFGIWGLIASFIIYILIYPYYRNFYTQNQFYMTTIKT